MIKVRAKDFYSYPGGTLFAEYKPDISFLDLMVKDTNEFGATKVVPIDGEVFDYDWSLNEYKDDDIFVVFEEREILVMIKTLLNSVKLIDNDDLFCRGW